MAKPISTALGALGLFCFSEAFGQSAGELATDLANPVANLISLPIQMNWDQGFGMDDTDRFTTNVQPVIPIALNDDWNLISRTILPIVVDEASNSDIGFGDIVQSAFFSPSKPGPGGLIWGVGPVALLPSATSNDLGTSKFGLGPTAVALVQKGSWTYGALANHIWSVGGDPSRTDVNATFVQPFLSYITTSGTSYTVNSESTYNWESDSWTVPINAVVSQVVTVGDQLLSVGGGLRYYAESPAGGPEGLGARFVVTFLFPTGN